MGGCAVGGGSEDQKPSQKLNTSMSCLCAFVFWLNFSHFVHCLRSRVLKCLESSNAPPGEEVFQKIMLRITLGAKPLRKDTTMSTCPALSVQVRGAWRAVWVCTASHVGSCSCSCSAQQHLPLARTGTHDGVASVLCGYCIIFWAMQQSQAAAT